MGTAYYSLRQPSKAAEYYGQSLKLLDRMSEREKYRTLGLHSLTVSRNYEQAIVTFKTLVERYPADRAGHANLALAYVYVRNFAGAMSEGRKAIELYPKNIVQRTNYAMYAMYAGDFTTAIEQAKIVLQGNPSFEYAILTIARSAAGAGDLPAAKAAYTQLSQVSPLGASMAALGEIDLAMYQGRFREALRLIAPITARTPASDDSRAALVVALAETNQALGRRAEAVREATRAAKLDAKNESILFPAARILIDDGRTEAALAIARDLENLLQNQTASYARLIDGELALKSGRLLTAIDAFREGQKRHDSWYSHFLLGRTYIEARHYAEALPELELCLKRKGEVTDVFITDSSTLRYLPPLYYWLARAQQGLGNSGARENYQKYLDMRRNADTPDPLADDIRVRLAAR
jgi:tetratricopeptide (TPR) repeat protein